MCLIPGWEDPLKETSILAWRIPVDRGAWQAVVHGVTKSQTGLSTHMSPSKGCCRDSLSEMGVGCLEVFLACCKRPSLRATWQWQCWRVQ